MWEIELKNAINPSVTLRRWVVMDCCKEIILKKFYIMMRLSECQQVVLKTIKASFISWNHHISLKITENEKR